MESVELKEIRGINIRLILVATAAIITFISTASYFVASIREDIKNNGLLLNTLLTDQKEYRKTLEEMQRTTEIRLTIIETQLKIKTR